MGKKTNQKNKVDVHKHTIKTEGYSSDNKKVVWRFDMIDRSGKFAFDLNRDDFQYKDFLEKLIDYSSMTWTENQSIISFPRSHYPKKHMNG